MWAYARATIRDALASPVSYGLLAGSLFLSWCGAALSILALHDQPGQRADLVAATSEMFALLVGLGLLGRTLDEDRASGFVEAADATRLGPPGRVLGRWGGAVLCALVCGMLSVGGMLALRAAPPQAGLYLLTTSIPSLLVALAWGALFAALLSGVVGTLVTFTLWLAGHLPWGTAPFLEGGVGRALRAVLPGPRPHVGMAEAWPPALLATAGVLAIAVALAGPARPRG